MRVQYNCPRTPAPKLDLNMYTTMRVHGEQKQKHNRNHGQGGVGGY
jgi:hypothetical protein